MNTHTPQREQASTPYSPAFELMMQWLHEVEGIDSNHPNDKGGRTRFGISQRAYPNLDIANLTWLKAKGLYHRDYFRASGAQSLFENGTCDLGWILMDSAVQHGTWVAIELLQRTVGAKPDGRFGPKTLAKTLSECSTPQSSQRMLQWFLARRSRKYHRICTENPEQNTFFLGWQRRLFKLQHRIYHRYSEVV